MRKYVLTVVVLLAITSALPSTWAQSRGKGTGGIPAVLNELDEVQRRLDQIEAQMQANQAALLARFDMIVTLMETNNAALLARFDTVDEDALMHHDAVAPCTIERFIAGKCHPLDFETSICFNVGVGADGSIQWELASGYTVEAGAAWKAILDLEFSAQLEVPFGVQVLPLPPIFFPDIAVGAQLSAGGEAQICFAGLSVAFSDIFGTASGRASADAFAQRWVDALQDTGPEILNAMCTFADGKNLTPDGLVAPLNLLRTLEATVSGCDDPLEILKEGQLREFLDSLPAINGMADLCDNPGQLLPPVDLNDPLGSVCAQVASMPVFGAFVTPLCDTLNDLPNLAVIEDVINGLVDGFTSVLCFFFPDADLCSNDRTGGGSSSSPSTRRAG